MRNFLKNNYRGFTFIELIISISIFALITTTMLANFRSGNRSSELYNSAETVANKLREAQTRALTGAGGIGTTGHGIYMQNGDTTFLSYRDDVANTNALEYDSGEESVTTGVLKHVEIDTDADITFRVPSGDLYESGTLQTGNITVTVFHTLTGLRRDITISGISGQITVGDSY